jgi:hypothetical protein
MAEPNCKIDWFYEGYRQVWLYDGADLSPDVWRDYCVAVAKAISAAETVEAVSDALDQLSAEWDLVAQVHRGPSHSDPVANTLRVGVFEQGSEPPTWSA